ncbi:hypothetical protein R6Q59_035034 [Mikania micrantha]
MRHSSRDSYFGQPRHGHGRPVSAQHATQYRKDSTMIPTETLLRLLLPLNDKVQWNSRDVAGSEPPTSPRS